MTAKGRTSNGHAPGSNGLQAVVPKFKKGDHARRLPNGPGGVVVRTDRNRALMLWGIQSVPGKDGPVEKRYEEWVPKVELELETVVSPDEVIKRQKQ